MMAEKNSDSPSVNCLIVSLPCGFLQLGVDEAICGLGSNTLLVNEKTAKTIKLNTQDGCNVLWVVLKLSLSISGFDESCDSYESKRLLQVLVDNRLGDEVVILGEDLVYNLEYSSGLRQQCSVSTVNKPKWLQLSCEDPKANLPPKATKVLLSLIQFENPLGDNLVDQVLQSYFSFPRYLCKNDVFGVHIPHHNKLDSIDAAKTDVIYFKVFEMEGNGVDVRNDISQGYLVDSSITIYQVSNTTDLYPPKRLAFDCACNVSLNELVYNEKLLNSFKSRSHNLIPECFDNTFQVLCKWMEPFLCGYKKLQDVELTPIFLISGPNGSGKTMLVEAVSHYFGTNYWRVDCVMLGEPIPGQVEGKLKAVFGKLSTMAPCILHLSQIQALFEDADGKDDVRVLTCFEQQIKSLKLKCPVVIIASTNSHKTMGANVCQLFIETINVNPLSQPDREDVLSWFVDCSRGVVDRQIVQAVAAQTSGYFLRDLEMLVSLAFKEKHNRLKEENITSKDFVFSDFSKIIGMMRKVFSESIGAPKVPSVSWKDVGGLEHLKKEILRSLRSNMFNTGLKRSGLLLHGPPGTGKTLLAKAVATQCGRNFLSVKGPELLNMYVGQSEHNVRDLFELAKAASPCIVFFDELDSLAPNRGGSGDSGGVMDRVVSQLLAEMDGLSSSADVFVLGATNRPDLIDPALLRPGRLDKLLYVGPCEDRASQLSVLNALTRKLTLSADVDLECLVESLPSAVSGAQLSALCSAAWLASARQLIHNGTHVQDPTVVVEQNHFLSALEFAFS